ncbi:MAG: DNA-formamidopyrimidine glycosylase family protein [bacterium]|nr:DNA-formamidopyrimidine glycosylase family protein [bacterium]
MPELPEVETIRKGLAKTIVGKKIVKFESRDPKVVRFEAKEIEGMIITNIERRAKILIFNLSNKKGVIPAKAGIQKESILDPRVSLDIARDKKPEDDKVNKLILIHLKMTGQLIWEACAGESEFCLKKSRIAGGHPSPDWVAKLPNAYTRAIFHFDDDSVLFFNDLRRFGYLKLYNLTTDVIPAKAGIQKESILDPRVSLDIARDKKPEDDKLWVDIPELAKLGPEPIRLTDARSGQALFDSGEKFTVEYLMKRAAKIPNRKIKQFITDQEIISGVGNIYVDEALFYAGVLPTRPVKEIKLSKWQKIKSSIIKALELGIKYGGSSEDTYVDAFGNQGTMGNHTKVYRRTGQPCLNGCGGVIKRITLGGRGTHFCPICQK